MDTLLLTFDDGPDESWTPVLLDTLRRQNLRATFFVIAARARRQPRLVERMLTDGHSVGLHCNVHERHSRHDRAWLETDTGRALEQLSLLGVVPTLWRTPWGDQAPWTQAVALRNGLRLVDWNVDTHDWRGDDAATMFAATREQLQPGAIVLAHDGLGPGARRAGASQTIAYVNLVAEHAGRRELRCAALI
jgi:peptidoglycan/xylan/chitin deacetylase (PgdA/CDA1 family)